MNSIIDSSGAARRQQILQLLSGTGYESIQALSHALGVSEMTVRRDLDQLQSKGLIRRTHGGAMSEASGQIDIDYRIRQNHNAAAKEQIAAAAAKMIQDDEVIYLDAGTTVSAMAKFLTRYKSLKVVTPSIPLAGALARMPGIECYMLGGQVRQSLMAVIGHLAEDNLASFRLDRAFLGTASFDFTRGLTHATPEDIPLKKLAARLAQRVVVLADRPKIGRPGSVYFLPPPQVHCLITDGDDEAVIHRFREEDMSYQPSVTPAPSGVAALVDIKERA
jgi:DeoR/GlpR family transcriptional regulator of sugar metabolism